MADAEKKAEIELKNTLAEAFKNDENEEENDEENEDAKKEEEKKELEAAARVH